ncbi:MAG: hydrogenase maturation nickel metallochaperone HypA [Campylobacterales bacterium]|nr:hydrogenase maturation nickel metallochaperone HypA [Campylobacterales bacterium]
MHEYSIVQALLTQCEEHAKANDAQHITRVEVKIGRLSGVEPHLLAMAFDTFKERTVCDGAEFVMQVQPVVITCKACGAQTTLEELLYRCPRCESLEVETVDGEGMYLMRLEME